jgi:hypothetical protein
MSINRWKEGKYTGRKLAFEMILIFSLVVIIDLIPVKALAVALNWIDMSADNFAGGDGTLENPYLIATPQQLARLAFLVNGARVRGDNYSKGKYFKLTANIDLAEAEWTPIGDERHYFQGHFNGDGRAIANMKISKDHNDRAGGLFGNLHESGSVSNLLLKGVDIQVGSSAGGIAEFNMGKVENCFVEGTIRGKGTLYVGGIVGTNKGTVEFCVSYCYVGGEHSVGGLVGLNEKEVLNCYASCDVVLERNYGNPRPGLLIGINEGRVEGLWGRGRVNGQEGGNKLFGFDRRQEGMTEAEKSTLVILTWAKLVYAGIVGIPLMLFIGIFSKSKVALGIGVLWFCGAVLFLYFMARIFSR